MSTSAFDPKVLEETVFDTPFATAPLPVPEGVFPGIIAEVEVRSVTTKKGIRAVLRLLWDLVSDELREQLQRERVTARQDIWLDQNSDGSLAVGPGQNWRLGRLLELFGLNKPGFSFGMFKGQGPVRCTVTQTTNEETGEIYSEVSRVDAID